MRNKFLIKQILMVLLLVLGLLKPITAHAWIDGNADGLVTDQ